MDGSYLPWDISLQKKIQDDMSCVTPKVLKDFKYPIIGNG